ncbi:MAG: hypothetical protein NTV09_07925 [Bacteroidetes bacterium]|nr:hypothetical protein [Bacteroidota bacterium]
MEIHKNTNKQLNDLLNEARHEKPVMNMKEVEGIINQGKYTPSAASRGFHIGMNNLIVLAGIVVSSFLTYMALKVDKGDLMSAPPKSNTEVAVGTSVNEASKNILSSNNVVGVPAALPLVNNGASAVKTSDRVQPKQNPSTLLASNKNLAATLNESDEDMSAPVAAKMPSGEYDITFNYAGQAIKMKLVGDEVAEFLVDGNVIPAEQYGDFDDILAEGKNYLIGNTHAEEEGSSLNLIKFFDGQLRADKILDKEVRYHFELSSSNLTIDGQPQSNDFFKKYKGLYESKTGKTITEGSVYKFERGAKSE